MTLKHSKHQSGTMISAFRKGELTLSVCIVWIRMSGRDLSGIIGIHWNYSDSTSRFPFSIPISYPKRYPVGFVLGVTSRHHQNRVFHFGFIPALACPGAGHRRATTQDDFTDLGEVGVPSPAPGRRCGRDIGQCDDNGWLSRGLQAESPAVVA